jgi:hypothetical protein
MLIGLQHDPFNLASSGSEGIEFLNDAEQDELPFLLKYSNCAARASLIWRVSVTFADPPEKSNAGEEEK